MIQGIEQGVCTECGDGDDNYSQMSRDYDTGERKDAENVGSSITRTVRCSCGAGATVSITETGLETEGPISHENASWNQSDSEESQDSD